MRQGSRVNEDEMGRWEAVIDGCIELVLQEGVGTEGHPCRS